MEQLVCTLRNVRGALVAPPASFEAIEETMGRLYERDLFLMPDELMALLRLADGFCWNGIDFYGTAERATRQHIVPDIVTANEEFADRYPWGSELLVVGRRDDELYTFDVINGHWEARDRADGLVYETHPTLRELLVSLGCDS